MKQVMHRATKRHGQVSPATPSRYMYEIVENGEAIIIKDGDKTNKFYVGDMAEYGSYNLSYFGPITKITDKAVTIEERFGQQKTVHRLDLYKFCWRNIDFNLSQKAAQNAETSMYI